MSSEQAASSPPNGVTTVENSASPQADVDIGSKRSSRTRKAPANHTEAESKPAEATSRSAGQETKGTTKGLKTWTPDFLLSSRNSKLTKLDIHVCAPNFCFIMQHSP